MPMPHPSVIVESAPAALDSIPSAILTDPALTDAQVSAALGGISIDTLAQWRHRGVGPRFVKIGRSVRYLRSDVEQWLREARRQSTAKADR